MKICPNSYAIFWRSPGYRTQHHADGWKLNAEEPPRYVVARFRLLFPGDIVCSVRDGSGRFLPYANKKARRARRAEVISMIGVSR